MAGIVSALTNLVGGNLADGIANVVKLFKVDPNLVLQEQEKLADIQATLQGKILDGITAQVQVNAAEAQSKNIFVAGWRPFIGWACGAAFVYSFIVQPIILTVLVSTHSTVTKDALPTVDITSMLPVLLGMLGLGTMRTVEKVQGIPDSHPMK